MLYMMTILVILTRCTGSSGKCTFPWTTWHRIAPYTQYLTLYIVCHIRIPPKTSIIQVFLNISTIIMHMRHLIGASATKQWEEAIRNSMFIFIFLLGDNFDLRHDLLC